MRIIAWSTLRDWIDDGHKDAAKALSDWNIRAKTAAWKTPQDVKGFDPAASIVRNNRVVFDVLGNKYRLVVGVNYEKGLLFIRFIGTHQEYDKIDVETV